MQLQGKLSFNDMGVNDFNGSAHVFVCSSLHPAPSPENTFLVPLEVTANIQSQLLPVSLGVVGSVLGLKPVRTEH